MWHLTACETFDYLPWQITHSLYVYIQSLTTASGSQFFGSVVKALDFYPDRLGSKPTIGGNFFSYVSFICYDFHVVRWGLVRDWTLIHRTWLHVIINDDFLEEGECYGLSLLPSIICLGKLRIACTYIFNVWQMRQGRLFGSVVKALDFYPDRLGTKPTIGGKFFQLCFIPLLRLSSRKISLSFLKWNDVLSYLWINIANINLEIRF